MKPSVDLAPAIGVLAAQWGQTQGSSLPAMYQVAKSMDKITPEKLAVLKQAVLKNASDNEAAKLKLQIEALNSFQQTGTVHRLIKLKDEKSMATDPAPLLKARSAAAGASNKDREHFLNRFHEYAKPNVETMNATTKVLGMKNGPLAPNAATNYIVRAVLKDTGPMHVAQEKIKGDPSILGQFRDAWAQAIAGKLSDETFSMIQDHAKGNFGAELSQLKSVADNFMKTAGGYKVVNPRMHLDGFINSYELLLKKAPLSEDEMKAKALEQKKLGREKAVKKK
jgi:hypothetical protein